MTEFDAAQLAESGALGTMMDAHDPITWKCLTELRKWHDPDDAAPFYRPEDELLVVPGNLLVYGGASAQWQTLIGGGAGVTLFNNANATIGVGDSNTAAAAGQTDLQAATNKFRRAMDATYPLHTDSPTNAAANTCTFRSTFGNAEANFTWNEWGVFNGALTTGAAAGGRMLNRAVQALGAKASGSWQLTVTLSLA